MVLGRRKLRQGTTNVCLTMAAASKSVCAPCRRFLGARGATSPKVLSLSLGKKPSLHNSSPLTSSQYFRGLPKFVEVFWGIMLTLMSLTWSICKAPTPTLWGIKNDRSDIRLPWTLGHFLLLVPSYSQLGLSAASQGPQGERTGPEARALWSTSSSASASAARPVRRSRVGQSVRFIEIEVKSVTA